MLSSRTKRYIKVTLILYWVWDVQHDSIIISFSILKDAALTLLLRYICLQSVMIVIVAIKC